MAHRVISLQSGTSIAFGVKRSLLSEARSIATIASRLTLKIFRARRDGMADFNRPTSSLRYQRMVF
jgi:hypothetical protein